MLIEAVGFVFDEEAEPMCQAIMDILLPKGVLYGLVFHQHLKEIGGQGEDTKLLEREKGGKCFAFTWNQLFSVALRERFAYCSGCNL